MKNESIKMSAYKKVREFNDKINEALSKNNFDLATKLSKERDRMFIKYLFDRDKKSQES